MNGLQLVLPKLDSRSYSSSGKKNSQKTLKKGTSSSGKGGPGASPQSSPPQGILAPHLRRFCHPSQGFVNLDKDPGLADGDKVGSFEPRSLFKGEKSNGERRHVTEIIKKRQKKGLSEKKRDQRLKRTMRGGGKAREGTVARENNHLYKWERSL